jgi:hypothetical protein
VLQNLKKFPSSEISSKAKEGYEEARILVDEGIL